jgi:hypothetical protein
MRTRLPHRFAEYTKGTAAPRIGGTRSLLGDSRRLELSGCDTDDP